MVMKSRTPLTPKMIAVRTKAECKKRGIKAALYRYCDQNIVRGWEYQIPLIGDKFELIGVYDQDADVDQMASDIRAFYGNKRPTLRQSGAGMPNAKGAIA